MLARLALPFGFSLDTVVRSHGWYDLPPFDYDRDAGLLRTHVEVTARDGGPGEAAEIRFRVRNGKLEASADRLDSRALRNLARRVFSLALSRRYRRFGAHRRLALWLDMTRDWHSE